MRARWNNLTSPMLCSLCVPINPNNFTKYLIYLLAVAIVLVVMLLLKDNISLWLSRVGTYVLMFGFTFFAGWLLGHMDGRAECRRRTEELQRRIDELEGNH